MQYHGGSSGRSRPVLLGMLAVLVVGMAGPLAPSVGAELCNVTVCVDVGVYSVNRGDYTAAVAYGSHSRSTIIHLGEPANEVQNEYLPLEGTLVIAQLNLADACTSMGSAFLSCSTSAEAPVDLCFEAMATTTWAVFSIAETTSSPVCNGGPTAMAENAAGFHCDRVGQMYKTLDQRSPQPIPDLSPCI